MTGQMHDMAQHQDADTLDAAMEDPILDAGGGP